MKVNSKFKIKLNTDLSQKDFQVLTFLYQPLIGITAYSIYQSFYNLFNQTHINKHQSLYDLLNITQKEFIEAREKLEALGLLETYEDKSTSNYIYILKPPYSAKKFLLDTFLGTYLETEIGTSNLNDLIKIFEIEREDLKTFKNITKSFDDIYEIRSRKLLTINKDIIGRSSKNNLIRNSIDYNLFIEKLPRAFKDPSLFNENFKQKILQLAFVYNFSLEDMITIYTNAHRGKKGIDIEQINLQAKKYYETLNENIRVEKKSTNDEALIESLSFRNIVNRFGSNNRVDKSNALSTINEFITQNEIDRGVLNVLLMFIFKNKNGVLPHVNYLNKVWESWYKNGVRTTSDAIKHREYIESYYSSKGSKTKKVNKPDWLDEYMVELEKMEG